MRALADLLWIAAHEGRQMDAADLNNFRDELLLKEGHGDRRADKALALALSTEAAGQVHHHGGADAHPLALDRDPRRGPGSQPRVASAKLNI